MYAPNVLSEKVTMIPSGLSSSTRMIFMSLGASLRRARSLRSDLLWGHGVRSVSQKSLNAFDLLPSHIMRPTL
jgi:hypothetical protein